MTVGELLGRIDSRELTEWAAYEREAGPLGSERGDYNAAVVAQTVATMLGSGQGRRPRLADFIPQWGRRQGQSAEEMLDVFRGLASTKKD